MKRKLWALAFALTLLKSRLDFFHGGTEADGTLEAQGAASVST